MNKRGQIDIADTLESPGFWILGGGAVLMTVFGWIFSKRSMGLALPIWQLIVILLAEVIAAALFSQE